MKNSTLDQVMDSLTEDLQRYAMENRFPYIFSKAELYLRLGPEKYRKADFFGVPRASLSPEELAVIELGCKQVLEGKGLSREVPFTDLGIPGFRILFQLFHFEVKGHKAKKQVIDGKTRFIDEMVLEHVMDQTEIRYFNLV